MHQPIYETQNIELYLPCHLVDIDGDRWFIERSLSMAKLNMTIGHSTRLQAVAKLHELQELHKANKTDQLKEHLKNVRGNPVLDYYFRQIPAWKDCWETVNDSQIDCLSDVLCSISHLDMKDETVIESKLQGDRKNYVIFKYSPSVSNNAIIQEGLKPLIKLGVPVIWWPRHNGGFEDISDLEQTLQECIFDKYKNREIANIYDFVQIITEIRRDSRLCTDDQTHIGKHLTLIVDNPHRSILERTRLIT